VYEVFQYRDLRMLSRAVVLGGFALPEEVDRCGGEEGGVEDVREVFGDGHPLRDYVRRRRRRCRVSDDRIGRKIWVFV